MRITFNNGIKVEFASNWAEEFVIKADRLDLMTREETEEKLLDQQEQPEEQWVLVDPKDDETEYLLSSPEASESNEAKCCSLSWQCKVILLLIPLITAIYFQIYFSETDEDLDHDQQIVEMSLLIGIFSQLIVFNLPEKPKSIVNYFFRNFTPEMVALQTIIINKFLGGWDTQEMWKFSYQFRPIIYAINGLDTGEKLVKKIASKICKKSDTNISDDHIAREPESPITRPRRNTQMEIVQDQQFLMHCSLNKKTVLLQLTTAGIFIGLGAKGLNVFDGQLFNTISFFFNDFGLILIGHVCGEFIEKKLLPLNVLLNALIQFFYSTTVCTGDDLPNIFRSAMLGVILGYYASYTQHRRDVRRIRIGMDALYLQDIHEKCPELTAQIKANVDAWNRQYTSNIFYNPNKQAIHPLLQGAIYVLMLSYPAITYGFDANERTLLQSSSSVFLLLGTYFLINKIKMSPCEDYFMKNNQTLRHKLRSFLHYYLQEAPLNLAVTISYLVEVWSKLRDSNNPLAIAYANKFIIPTTSSLFCIIWAMARAEGIHQPYLGSYRRKYIKNSIDVDTKSYSPNETPPKLPNLPNFEDNFLTGTSTLSIQAPTTITVGNTPEVMSLTIHEQKYIINVIESDAKRREKIALFQIPDDSKTKKINTNPQVPDAKKFVSNPVLLANFGDDVLRPMLG